MQIVDPIVKQRAEFVEWRFPCFSNDASEIAAEWSADEAEETAAGGKIASPRVLVDDLARYLDLIPRRIAEGHTDDAAWMADCARVALARLALAVRQ